WPRDWSSDVCSSDLHSSQEAPEPKLDLGTLALVAPEALLQLLIRMLEAGHPGRERIIPAVDLVLAGQRAPHPLVRVAVHRAMSEIGRASCRGRVEVW